MSNVEPKSDRSSDGSGTQSESLVRRPEGRYPPNLKYWQEWLIWAIYGLWLVEALFLVEQLSLHRLPTLPILIYAAGGLFIGSFLLERHLKHKVSAHEARLEDASEVLALIVEAFTVESWKWEHIPKDDLQEKMDSLKKVAKHLETEGSQYWTEFNVLPLRQKLIDFLGIDDLRAQSQSILASLQEYSEDSSYRYDKEYYGKWNERINHADKALEDARGANAEVPYGKTEPLRAELRTVLGHVADYQAYWAEGSTIIRSLNMCGAAAIPTFLFMGLVPSLCPDRFGVLGIHNWGFLGIAGSITAVLLALRKSDLVEVGNTEGKRELWRAVLGAALGLVAGVLAYGIIGGGLIDGAAIPSVMSNTVKDVALTILWGVGAGFSFERVFERIRSTADLGG